MTTSETISDIKEIEIYYNISKCLSNKESRNMFGITHKKFERMLKKLRRIKDVE
jgi:hypothetical protein